LKEKRLLTVVFYSNMIYYEEEQRPYRLYVMADYIRSVQVSRKKKKRKYYIREKRK
jgi:ribosomal protein L28